MMMHPPPTHTHTRTLEQVAAYLESLGKGLGGGIAEAASMHQAYGMVFGEWGRACMCA
jgi:hypothetical protein